MKTTTQLLSVPADDSVDEALCAQLIAMLALLQAPITRAQLARRLRWNQRLVRRVAAACPEVISAPGLRGYQHVSHCTSAVYAHYRAARLSQCRKMKHKVAQSDALFYRRAR